MRQRKGQRKLRHRDKTTQREKDEKGGRLNGEFMKTFEATFSWGGPTFLSTFLLDQATSFRVLFKTHKMMCC